MALTDEDKAWLTQQLGALRDGLRVESKQDLANLRAEFKNDLANLRAEFKNDLANLRTELLERIEKSETTLLTEFHKWASPAELRQRSHAAAMRAFDAELEAVSDRVAKLEQKNPPAA